VKLELRSNFVLSASYNLYWGISNSHGFVESTSLNFSKKFFRLQSSDTFWNFHIWNSMNFSEILIIFWSCSRILLAFVCSKEKYARCIAGIFKYFQKLPLQWGICSELLLAVRVIRTSAYSHNSNDFHIEFSTSTVNTICIQFIFDKWTWTDLSTLECYN